MKEGFLNTIREYLLTFDENIRERIRISLAEDDFEILSNIENAFLSDKHINAIIQELQLGTIQEEIKDLHAEYYLQLAELYAEGKTNKEIETLLFSDNQTFKKTVSLFPDEATFFKELSIAVDDTKTEQLKKGYAEIDKWLESKKSSSNNDEASVVSIRRKIFRYAIAAAVVGVLIGGAYLRFFTYEVNNDNPLAHNDSLNNNKPLVANVELPNLIQSSESSKSIIFYRSSSGLAEKNETVTIKTNALSKQIDSLRIMLDENAFHYNKLKVEFDNKSSQLSKVEKQLNYLKYSSSRISNQIDSLLQLLNTYTFDFKNKKIVLNIPKVSIVGNVISIDPDNLSKLYLRVGDQYYSIEKSEKPVKLNPISDKSLIQELDFLNE